MCEELAQLCFTQMFGGRKDTECYCVARQSKLLMVTKNEGLKDNMHI